MKQKLLFLLWLLLPSICAQAQTGYVGIGTNTPKAKLDIVSDTSGLLIPRYATLALVNSSVLPIMSSSIHNGLLLYVNEAANRGFWFYNGTAFEKVGKSESFFKVSGSDTNQIIYSDNSKYGKNFLVNTDSVNYDGSGNVYTKMMLIPSKYAVRLGSIQNTNWDIDSIGDYSFASGIDTKASGVFSTAMGYNTTASGQSSIAMGRNTTASGIRSTAMGRTTTASGSSSIAMGSFTTASGHYSIAMGFFTNASGESSAAMGLETSSSGLSSIAMGSYTTASGENSTAMGLETIASGNVSTANGNNTLALSYGELATGSFNDTLSSVDAIAFAGDSNRVFTVGNGTSSARNTAFVVQQNGNVGVGARVPNSLLEVKGAIAMPFEIISGSLSLSNAHYTVKFIGASASSFTVTLPAASSCTGRMYKIINAGSSVGPSGTLNISAYLDYNGSSISTIAKANAITVQSDGTNWHLIP